MCNMTASRSYGSGYVYGIPAILNGLLQFYDVRLQMQR